MVETLTGKAETRRDIGEFEIRQFGHDLVIGKTSGQQIKHINDANPHAAHTRATAALIGVHRDAIRQFNGMVHGHWVSVKRNIAV
jgi:hypothetical protein